MSVHRERLEMHTMSAASEIAPNVFLGPTPDLANFPPENEEDADYDVFIEASDLAQIPDSRALKAMRSVIDQGDHPSISLEFPSSGSIMPPTWSQAEVDGLIEMCRWIHDIAAGAEDTEEHDLGSSLSCVLPLRLRNHFHLHPQSAHQSVSSSTAQMATRSQPC